MMQTQTPIWRLGADLARATDDDTRATIRRIMEGKRRHYRMGWNAGADLRYSSLDDAEDTYLHRHGTAYHDDWLAGWLDRAAGREFGHQLQCPEHGAGECA